MTSQNSRRTIALHSFIYGIMTLAVIVSVTIALGWTMGFRVNLTSGQLSRVALMQFNSFPGGANVSINGATIGSQTATHLNVDAGRKDIIISKTGYRNWSTTVNATPSDVIWLSYARLVPNRVETRELKSFANFTDAQMLASPDKNHLALQLGNLNDFMMVDVSNSTAPKFVDLKLDVNKLTAPAPGQTDKFVVIEWDPGSRYLLVRHDIMNSDNSPASSEIIEVDTQNPSFNNSDVRNLSKDFNVNLTDPHFAGSTGNAFFALTGSDVRKIDYGSNSLSAPLVSNVVNYHLYGNNIFAFTTRTVAPAGQITRVAGVYNDGKIVNVKTFADDQAIDAVFNNSEGTDYLAILHGDAGGTSRISIYTAPLNRTNNITNLKPIVVTLPFTSDAFANSTSGRLLVVTNGKNVFTYDLETAEKYDFQLSAPSTQLVWLDDYHLVGISSNGGQPQLAMFDFNGQNRQTITTGYGAAALSSDNKYVYSLVNRKTSGGDNTVVLQSSAMTTN